MAVTGTAGWAAAGTAVALVWASSPAILAWVSACCFCRAASSALGSLARLRLAEIELSFAADVFPPRQFDPQRTMLAMLEHFVLGVATLKGHKLINKLRQVSENE